MKFNFWSWLGLFSNILTIAVTSAVLILMAGLGRRHRGNCSFAAFLFCVFGWIGSGQSTQVLLWLNQGDPTLSLRLTAAFFYLQSIALFYFAGRLTKQKRTWFPLSAGAGLAIGLAGLVPLVNHRIITNPSLSPTGLLRWDTSPLGYALVATTFAYLLASLFLLSAHHRQVPHRLITVGMIVMAVAEIVGLSGSLLSLPFPLLSPGVSAGISILGICMVHFQVFKPLNETTRELRERQADLEERNRRLEEVNIKLRELDEWKEKMTHMVIHDVKSPLNVINVVLNDFSYNLSSKMDRTQHQLLQSALISTHRIQSLISSMLDVRRIEEGRLPINPIPFDLTSIIDDCIQTVKPLLSLYKITVNINKPQKALKAYADPAVTARVIENLLDNAAKFSPSPGTVDIRVSAEADKIRFSISDRGPGIPLVYQKQVFEKYFQISTEAHDTRSGAGLGLAFCKLALDAQGGRIWIESDGHSGTTFHFTLPIWNEPAKDANPPQDIASSTDE
jgi:signal transduction histidine kinase